MVELSVVIPVYESEGSLRELHARLTAAVTQVTPDYELVLVDDRSTDGGWDVLRELARADERVKAFRLSRNFGQHAAITAGLAQSSGRWTVVMDCDLQEPPEEIPHLYAKAQEGYDLVQGRRSQTQQSRVRRAAGRGYRRLRQRLLGSGTAAVDHSTLSILSRKVVDAFLSLRDKDREYLSVLDWLGYERATLEFRHAPRRHGRSAYTLGKLIRVAVDGVFFQSTTLLRWVVYLGFAFALAALALGAVFVYLYLTNGPSFPEGWTSLFTMLVFATGAIIMSLGITGLYIGKIFGQVKGRPLYIVDEAVVDREPVDVVPRAADGSAPTVPAQGDPAR